MAVSGRDGYYKWRNREPSNQLLNKLIVIQAMLQTSNQFKQRYGAPRLARQLNKEDVECSVNYIAKLLAECGLKARNGKRFKYPAAGKKVGNVSDNLLDREFYAEKPNEKWVSDITYIRTENGFVYLAVVMDLFSRKIIGWAMDDSMETELISDAFTMAVKNRKTEPGLLLHSDQGSQYCSGEYLQLLGDHGVKSSMSRKGNCWDNAAMESFFSRLKVESLFSKSFKTLKDAYSCVFEYIEMFYNSIRMHSANYYLSPNEIEEGYQEMCA